MRTYFIQAIRLTVMLFIVLAGLYPFLVAGIGKLARGQGKGVSIEAKGKMAGYENIGQKFTEDHYFWGRPSAVDYNAAGSGGSNKGPSNAGYLALVQARIDSLLLHNPGIDKADIPVDLVTASGSGLDPHISVQAARIQAKRIAKHRNLEESAVHALIDSHIEKPLFGWFGPEKINVLKLNIDLDKQDHANK